MAAICRPTRRSVSGLAGAAASRSWPAATGRVFLQILAGMSAEPGLYILDEPESALSFDSSLMLLTP
jgi:predicted ATPase